MPLSTSYTSTLSLHDALPILFPLSFIFVLPAQFGLFCVMWWMNSKREAALEVERAASQDADRRGRQDRVQRARDRKSTRLNSSHRCISYAVFCLKKKKKNKTE